MKHLFLGGVFCKWLRRGCNIWLNIGLHAKEEECSTASLLKVKYFMILVMF